MTNNASTDVLIVGSGLAGLRACQLLSAAGLAVTVVDQSDGPGGRVRSHLVDGFILDEGFQLINPSYPELRASGVLPALDLRPTDPVIRYVETHGYHDLVDPRFAPWRAASALRHPQLSLRDALRIARLFTNARLRSVESLTRGADFATADGLRAEGLSENVINGVLQPFLRGTVLDEALETSWHYTQLLIKSFVSGRPGTPAGGAQVLSNALLATSPGATVCFNTPVHAVTATSVTTDAGVLNARAVIVATDGTNAAELVGGEAPLWRTQTAYWCSVPALSNSGQFRIDAVRGLWNMLDISAAAPERSPAGRSLIVASAVGDVDDPSLLRDVARLYDLDVRDVVVLERQVITQALPVIQRPLDLHQPVTRGGVVVAGDYLSTPSIQGAMVSGRRAARAVLTDLSG